MHRMQCALHRIIVAYVYECNNLHENCQIVQYSLSFLCKGLVMNDLQDVFLMPSEYMHIHMMMMHFERKIILENGLKWLVFRDNTEMD